MPRSRSTTPNGVIASGVNISAKKKDPKPLQAQLWQNTAWGWYDMIGEYRYAVGWVGNLLSRVKLTVLKDGSPTQDAEAVELLGLLFGGPEGQVEMWRQLGIHFTVAGEAYVVAEDQGEEVDDKWYVVAATEMKRVGDGDWRMGKKKLDDPLVVHLRKPHPRKHNDSDSPTRAVLPILAEIDGLTKHVGAQIDSRLAGAGMLVLPNEINFASAHTKDSEGRVSNSPEESARAFLETLGQAMIEPINNRESADAVVPIVLQAEGEHLKEIQHITFWTPLDEHAIELRTEAIRRLALGMDMPPETLTGTEGMNHWGAWQMEESQIKGHTEPLIRIILQSLTEGYLRDQLVASGMDPVEAHRYEFGADTTELKLRPNRSKEAIELYQMGELSAAAMRRENGFSEDDAPTDEERKLFLIRRVASGSTTPELVGAALAELGVDLRALVAEMIDNEPTEARPQPSVRNHPVRALPERPDTPDDGEEMSVAIAASQMMVLRALERVGNRMKPRHSVLPAGVDAVDAYMHYDQVNREKASELLDGAWTYVDRMQCALPPEFLERELHEFTTTLIADKRQFEPKILSDYLRARAYAEGVCL